eukprot:COSAG02_NODE_55584_length_289_cov_1.510526_1_plen_45_part_10
MPIYIGIYLPTQPTMSVRAGRGRAGQKNVPWLDKDVSGCALMDAD